jgi:hypothetical protein
VDPGGRSSTEGGVQDEEGRQEMIATRKGRKGVHRLVVKPHTCFEKSDLVWAGKFDATV